MTQITPKLRRYRGSRYSSMITTANRGYAEVILDGTRKGTITMHIVMSQGDWFLRTSRLNSSDYAILRCCKFLKYDRLTKTFTIRDPLVVGQLAKKGVKPIVVGKTTTVPYTSSQTTR